MVNDAAVWTIASLGELGEFRNGVNFSKKDYGDGLPIVNVKQLYRGRYADVQNLLQVRRSAISNVDAVVLQYGDILFARSSVKASGAGQAAMVGPCPLNAVFSGFIIRFRIKATNRAVPEFINYMLRSPSYREILTRIGSGTTITNLSQSTLAGLQVRLPPVNEQQAIARILGTLDDKIELNRRMNETLEGMARAIFKSWFVDFDPVRAKAAGQQPPGLAPHIADLFPDAFEASELGEIPKGWKVGTLLDQAELVSGGTPKTSQPDYWGGDILWASAKDVSQCSECILISTDRTITPLGLAQSSTKMVDAFSTVIVARGATTGRFVMLGSDMAMNQTCYALHSRFNCHFALNCQIWHVIQNLVQAAHGSVFNTITTRTFRTSLILLPPKDILHRFDEMVTPIFERILRNQEESRTLAALRDTLLPRLISGELRVRPDPKGLRDL